MEIKREMYHSQIGGRSLEKSIRNFQRTSTAMAKLSLVRCGNIVALGPNQRSDERMEATEDKKTKGKEALEF